MIVYCDLHRPPVFRDMFAESGVVQQNHYRSIFAMLLERRYPGKFVPDSWLYPAFEKMKKEDTVIVFDSYTTRRYLRRLCETFPDKRIILWFWNPVKDPAWLRKIPVQIEQWTYSRADSTRYGLRYNTQFFFDCLAEEAEACRKEKQADPPEFPKALFVGRDKKRAAVLKKWEEALTAAGAAVDLRIVPDPPKKPGILYEELITYREIISLVKEADVILDYSTDPDAGLSMRPFEAMFFGKKLITNQREILQADFYDPANIYLCGQDSRSLKEFLGTPQKPVDAAVRDRYLLSNWLQRFETEEAGL